MKRVCLVKSEICDAYTRIFGTRREKHNLIKFIGKVFCVILRSLTGTPRDTVYPWGKGINKQKTSIFVFSVK